ncbi:hypothetical protein FACS1894211_12100 [Clostridia bacterium]|nr:hypothetical protein FACS1894211_12100 [Clostridia bacterium]
MIDESGLMEFGRALFETADNTAMLLPALNSMLTAKQYDEIFVIMQCSFINSHYYGFKYNSNLKNATIEERYFDRFMEILQGIGIAENVYAPLLFYALDPSVTTPARHWRRPAYQYLLKAAYKDYDRILGLVNRFVPRETYPYDVLLECNRDKTVGILQERKSAGTIADVKNIYDYLKRHAPEALAKKPEKREPPIEPDFADADGLIAFCRAHRDGQTVKKIRAALKFVNADDLAGMADYLLAEYDAANKKTAYLSRFFAAYGSDALKSLLPGLADTGAKPRRYDTLLSALDMSVEDLEDGRAPDCELNAELTRMFTIDGFDLFVRVLPGLQIKMCDADGRDFTFSIGATPKKYVMIKRHIETYVRNLRAELDKQRERFFDAFRFFRKWSMDNFKAHILNNSLMRAVASEFFCGEYSQDRLVNVFFSENGLLYDLDRVDFKLSGLSVALIHPIDLEGRYAHLKRLDIEQPFPQLRRETFLRLPEAGGNISRFKGTVVRSDEFLRRIKRGGWKLILKRPDGAYGGISKNFNRLPCTLEFQNLYPGREELLTVGLLKTPEENKRVFSEICYEINELLQN